MNKREYLRSLGYTVGERGRFAPDAMKALADAPAGSFTEPVKAAPAVKRVSLNSESKAPRVDKPKSSADPSAVRKWAQSTGLAVGARGRIHADVYAAYEAAQTESGEVIEERKPSPSEFHGPTAPCRVPSDTKWGWTDPKGKLWTASVKTACATSNYSLGWCPCPNDEHVGLVGGGHLDLVPLTRI